MFEDYKGRRVLVTGHTGFKGAWLTQWLRLLGADVSGLALPPDTDPSLFTLLGAGADYSSHFIDLADAAGVAARLGDLQPEIIFHLGAQSLVRRSYHSPVETLMTNVMGTAHLLQSARALPGLKAVVVVTSDKVYRNTETGRAFVEDDALGGDDPYSASKAAAEIVTHSFRQSFFQTGALIASVRAGNVFGGGDWCADRLLPDIARAMAADQTVVLRNPDSIRPWQYVLEALSGYLMLGARLARGDRAFAQSWNFGPTESESMNVGDFTKSVIAAWGKGEIVVRPEAGAPKEAKTLRLDSAKSRERLGWKPVLTLEEAIAWSVAWYREVAGDPARAPALTQAQIQDFNGRLRQAGLT